MSLYRVLVGADAHVLGPIPPACTCCCTLLLAASVDPPSLMSASRISTHMAQKGTHPLLSSDTENTAGKWTLPPATSSQSVPAHSVAAPTTAAPAVKAPEKKAADIQHDHSTGVAHLAHTTGALDKTTVRFRRKSVGAGCDLQTL